MEFEEHWRIANERRAFSSGTANTDYGMERHNSHSLAPLNLPRPEYKGPMWHDLPSSFATSPSVSKPEASTALIFEFF